MTLLAFIHDFNHTVESKKSKCLKRIYFCFDKCLISIYPTHSCTISFIYF